MGARRTGLTIILVDDDPLMHRMLVPRLQEMSTTPPVTRVLAALTPEAALAHVRGLPSDPLVVVTDFNLKAAANGLQLLKEVRDLRPDAVRILFSGYSMEQLGDVARGADVHAFLEKPLLLDDLIAPLERVIARELAGHAQNVSNA